MSNVPPPPPPGGAVPPPPGGGDIPPQPPPGGDVPTPSEGVPGGSVPPAGGTLPPTQPAPSFAAPSYQPPPTPAAGGSGGSNGAAIAALVFGILSFVCLPFLGPILAIVFGFIGLNKAKQVGTGRGMSIAGLVLGVLGFLAAIVATIVLIAVGGNAADEIDDAFGDADPDTYELTAGTCELDEFGFVTYTGEITNTSNESKSFTISAEFTDTDTNTIVDNDLADIVTDLSPDQTAEWSITGSTDPGTNVTCTVTSVENFFN